MKIHILANDGSQLGVTPETIYGDGVQLGVGGAELAILTLGELWTQRGYDVTFYNNPRNTSDRLKQAPIAAFNPQENRDILIIYRSPNQHVAQTAKGKKVWFSTDQYAGGTAFNSFSKVVDTVVCISPRHIEYFEKHYGITNAIYMDLPVRIWDYDIDVEKVPGRLIFSSVPHRGLSTLGEVYPYIKERVPEVSLVVTSDYRLWGPMNPANNQSHMMKFIRMPDVQFMGAIPRERLVIEQKKADILSYPCVYDELFCYSVAEAQVAGAYPITSNVGSLATTNMGLQIAGEPMPMYPSEPGFSQGWRKSFADAVVEFLRNRPALLNEQSMIMSQARDRFNPDNILAQWDMNVFDA